MTCRKLWSTILLDFCIQFEVEVEVECKIWGHEHEKNAAISARQIYFVFIARWRTSGVMIASGVDLGSSNNSWKKNEKTKCPDIDLVANFLPFCGYSRPICAHIATLAAFWGSKCGIMGYLKIQISYEFPLLLITSNFTGSAPCTLHCQQYGFANSNSD